MIEFLKDLWLFIKTRKKWWLVPMIVILLVIGLLIVFVAGSAIAPFVYTLF
jgi:competence protein ComGC